MYFSKLPAEVLRCRSWSHTPRKKCKELGLSPSPIRELEGEGVVRYPASDHDLVDEDVDPNLRGGGGAARAAGDAGLLAKTAAAGYMLDDIINGCEVCLMGLSRLLQGCV